MGLKEEIEKSIAKTLKVSSSMAVINATSSPAVVNADYTSYLAFNIAKQEGKNPFDVAQNLVGTIKNSGEFLIIADISLAANGFINFALSREILLKELKKILNEKENYGSSALGRNKTVVIDYSGPNIAKRFGVGHLRSTVIGQALYNLYKFLGYNVIGENHLGDWGTQFGMIIAQITRKDLDASKLTVEDLEQLYVEFNQEMAVDRELREQAKFWFKKLEEGDEVARKIWQEVRKVSLQEFEKIYDLLDVHIDNAHGESFYCERREQKGSDQRSGSYKDTMGGVLEELEQKHLVKESEGARIVEIGEGMPPAMVIKSDGTSTYLLRDLATIKFRLSEWNPDEIIYEVGSDQLLHFRQLFRIADLLGWSEGKVFKHVAHGLIRFKEGKMSTRQGKTVKLEEVLQEAIKRARGIIENSETGRGLSEKGKEKVAGAVGIGAIKYFDLSHNPASDIIFDWEKLFMLEGNSAPYLQYTYARIQSILAKAGRAPNSYHDIGLDEAETKVARALIHFPDVALASALQYSPNLLCNFLFELAQTYNNFYATNRVLNSRREDVRLAISAAVAQVLQNGLSLLGIQAPDRM